MYCFLIYVKSLELTCLSCSSSCFWHHCTLSSSANHFLSGVFSLSLNPVFLLLVLPGMGISLLWCYVNKQQTTGQYHHFVALFVSCVFLVFSALHCIALGWSLTTIITAFSLPLLQCNAPVPYSLSCQFCLLPPSLRPQVLLLLSLVFLQRKKASSFASDADGGSRWLNLGCCLNVFACCGSISCWAVHTGGAEIILSFFVRTGAIGTCQPL